MEQGAGHGEKGKEQVKAGMGHRLGADNRARGRSWGEGQIMGRGAGHRQEDSSWGKGQMGAGHGTRGEVRDRMKASPSSCWKSRLLPSTFPSCILKPLHIT